MLLNINEYQRKVLLAAVDMYEGSVEAGIKESVECAEIEENLRSVVGQNVDNHDKLVEFVETVRDVKPDSNVDLQMKAYELLQEIGRCE